MTAFTKRLDFPGHDGGKLAARLDLPAGTPRAYAIFAHCFTCSKDIRAASRIAAGLSGRGIAVLRFDFTGLGMSEGEFANTNFSSNVGDLVAAAVHLREIAAAPQLLVGHSLGGAAVLAAAAEIPEVRAVATIGAPSDADHVVENFAADVERIEAEGEAEVHLAGRKFTIRKQFLEDVRKTELAGRIGAMKRPLLVMHAPRDEIVGIDNASKIFLAARHPKSFVSLDDADHLLTRAEDADYAAEVLAAWAARYLDAPTAAEDGPVRVRETGASTFQAVASVGAHALLVDEPASVPGGTDTGPTPYDLLSMALGACTTMTLRMYAERKGMKLGRLGVTVSHGKIHARDCEDCADGLEGRIDRFERVLEVEGEIDPESRDKLIEIAGKCPVHRTLEARAAVVTRLAEDAPAEV